MMIDSEFCWATLSVCCGAACCVGPCAAAGLANANAKIAAEENRAARPLSRILFIVSPLQSHVRFLHSSIAGPRQTFRNVGQVVEPPTLGGARKDPPRGRFEQVKQAGRRGRDTRGHAEERDV